MKGTIMGDAANNPAVQRSYRRMRREQRDVGDKLVQGLLEQAAAEGRFLTMDDIVRILGPENRPKFMRSIIIELMVCIREKPK